MLQFDLGFFSGRRFAAVTVLESVTSAQLKKNARTALRLVFTWRVAVMVISDCYCGGGSERPLLHVHGTY